MKGIGWVGRAGAAAGAVWPDGVETTGCWPAGKLRFAVKLLMWMCWAAWG